MKGTNLGLQPSSGRRSGSGAEVPWPAWRAGCLWTGGHRAPALTVYGPSPSSLPKWRLCMLSAPKPRPSGWLRQSHLAVVRQSQNRPQSCSAGRETEEVALSRNFSKENIRRFLAHVSPVPFDLFHTETKSYFSFICTFKDPPTQLLFLVLFLKGLRHEPQVLFAVLFAILS